MSIAPPALLRRIGIAMLAMALMVFPPPANAAGGPFTVQSCATSHAAGQQPPAPWQLTRIVVTCVDGIIRSAVQTGMQALSKFMVPIAALIFLLALGLAAWRLFLGDWDGMQEAVGFFIRLAIVVMFFINMGGLSQLPFNAVDQLSTIVSGGPPWDLIDLKVSRLLGFAPQVALVQGMFGLISTAFFSAGDGMMLFFLGFIVIWQIIKLMYRAVYTYLLAMIVLGYGVFISALIIPMGVFQRTEEQYVQKWISMMLAAILVPVMLFGALWIFLGLVDTAVASLFNVLGDDFAKYVRATPPMFSWTVFNDPTLMKQYESDPTMPASAPIVQSFINPTIGRGMSMNLLSPSVIDFGANHFKRMQELILQLVSFSITLYLVSGILQKLPGIAEDIAGVITGMAFEEVPLTGQMNAMSGMGGGS